MDTSSLERALRLRDRLAGVVSYFKIGKELFTAAGPAAVHEFTAVGRVFLDLKFHDIPATVAGAVRAAVRHRVSILDVHASGGDAMVAAAAEAAGTGAGAGRERPLLLAITVLTHLDAAAAAKVWPGSAVADQVRRLAGLARAAGADGVVASAAEAVALREAFGDELVLLVPGIRPRWAAEAHDQRRVATPGEAARRGANYLVIGRAITNHPDPREAVLRIRDEMGA